MALPAGFEKVEATDDFVAPTVPVSTEGTPTPAPIPEQAAPRRLPGGLEGMTRAAFGMTPSETAKNAGAVLANLANTVALGSAPLLGGAFQAAREGVRGTFGLPTDRAPGDEGLTPFQAGRHEVLRAMDQLRKEAPVGSAVGDIGGLIASVATGGAGAQSARAAQVLQALAGTGRAGAAAARALPVLASAGKTGALGALAGAGSSTAPTTEGMLEDADFGGKIGVAASLGLPAAGAVARRGAAAVEPWLRRRAQTSALKGAGWIQKDLKPLLLEAEGEQDIARRGQFLADEGVLGPVAASKENVARSLQTIADEQGPRIGELFERSGQQVTFPEVMERVNALRQRLTPTQERMLMPEIERLVADLRSPKVFDVVDDVAQRSIPARQMNQIKSEVDALVKWRPTTEVEAATNRARREVANLYRGTARDAARRGLSGEDYADLERTMERYGLASELAGTAREGVAREAGNKFLTLGTMLAAAAGGNSSGGALSGLAAAGAVAGAHKLNDLYGASVAANILRGLAGGAEGIATSPEAQRELGQAAQRATLTPQAQAVLREWLAGR